MPTLKQTYRLYIHEGFYNHIFHWENPKIYYNIKLLTAENLTVTFPPSCVVSTGLPYSYRHY